MHCRPMHAAQTLACHCRLQQCPACREQILLGAGGGLSWRAPAQRQQTVQIVCESCLIMTGHCNTSRLAFIGMHT